MPDSADVKRCIKCEKDLPLKEFYKSSIKGREHLYRPRCKGCYRQQDTEWRNANRELIRKRSKQYSKTYKEKHPDASSQINRRYRETHLEERRKYGRDYWKAHPEKSRQLCSRRRARLVKASGHHSLDQWMARVEFFGWRCVYCCELLTSETLSKDHMIPLSRGGSDWASNLAPACGSCNSRKYNRTFLEYTTNRS